MPPSPPARKPRKALAFGASVAAALVAAECVLRTFAPLHLSGIRDAYEYDEVLGVRLKPGVHLVETKDYREEVRVNRLGTLNFEEDVSGYERRVFALGDSYTQGVGAPPDTSYPFELGLLLDVDADGQYQRRHAVLNLGLSAYGGEQSLLVLDRYRARVGRPDVVLYLGSDNDADDDRLFLSGARHRHLVDGNPRYGHFLGLLQWLSRTEIGKRGSLARAVLAGNASSGVGAAGPETPVAQQQESIFTRLVARCAETQTRLVVSWSMPGASYDWLARWAADHGVSFADWAPSVASVQAAIPDLPAENDHSGGHHRAWVSRMIAAAYARQITRR